MRLHSRQNTICACNNDVKLTTEMVVFCIAKMAPKSREKVRNTLNFCTWRKNPKSFCHSFTIYSSVQFSSVGSEQLEQLYPLPPSFVSIRPETNIALPKRRKRREDRKRRSLSGDEFRSTYDLERREEKETVWDGVREAFTRVSNLKKHKDTLIPLAPNT